MSFSTLITRVNTTNCGNEVLSYGLQTILSKVLDMPVTLAERHPKYLAKYSFDGTSPELAGCFFNSYADTILGLYKSDAKKNGDNGQHIRRTTPKIKSYTMLRRCLLPLTRRLNTRKLLSNAGFFDRDIISRLSAYAESTWVVANPAGEISGTRRDIPVQLLLDAWTAKKLGARVAIVNHSIELKDEIFDSIIKFLYPKVDHVFVRDRQSLDHIAGLGIAMANVSLVPDAAILFQPDPFVCDASSNFVAPGSIGITINANAAASQVDSWEKLVRRIVNLGRRVVFLSSEYATDIAFARWLAERTQMDVQPAVLGANDYCAALSRLSLVLSNRLHTVVLATACGVAAVPIEAGAFKLGRTLEELHLPLETILPHRADWVEETVTAASRILTEGVLPPDVLLRSVSDARRRIEHGYRRLLTKGSYNRHTDDIEQALEQFHVDRPYPQFAR